MDRLIRALALFTVFFIGAKCLVPTSSDVPVDRVVLSEVTVSDKYTGQQYISTGKSVLPVDSYYLLVETPNGEMTSVKVPYNIYDTIEVFDTVYVELAFDKDGNIVEAALRD